MKNNNFRVYAEGGIMLALTVVLSQVTIYQLPNGGSINLGAFVPLLLFAFRWGPKYGIILGMAYGFLDFIMKPYFLNYLQFFLDYPIAYGMLGLAGFGKTMGEKQSEFTFRMLIFAMVGILGRFLAAVASGVAFFASYAPEGMNPIYYSITYNGSYILPNALISLLILKLLWPRVQSIGTKK